MRYPEPARQIFRHIGLWEQVLFLELLAGDPSDVSGGILTNVISQRVSEAKWLIQRRYP